MSIPDRVWRVVKGRWALAQEKLEDLEARTSAYEELAEALRDAPPVQPVLTPSGTPVLPTAPATAPRAGMHDPLAAAYELLQVSPGLDLPSLEQAYERRRNEFQPDIYPAGSAERAAIDARRAAIDAAYGKLRDALNPTETRFERLEF
jgi:hypothetical protein